MRHHLTLVLLVLGLVACPGTDTDTDPTVPPDTDGPPPVDTDDPPPIDTDTDTEPTTDTDDSGITGPTDCVDVDLGFAAPTRWTGGTVDASDADSSTCGGAGLNDVTFRFTAPNAGLFAFEVTDRTRMDAILIARPDCGLPETTCVNNTEFGREVMILPLEAFEEVVVSVDGGRSYVELDVVEAFETETVCRDGADQDFDDILDCADSDCWTAPECAEICDDGLDDNNSGIPDCQDPVCFDDPICVEICDDGVDNNQDGVFDCDDPLQCGLDPFCAPGCPDQVAPSQLPLRLETDTLGNVDDVDLSCGGITSGDVQIQYTATVTGPHVIDVQGSDDTVAWALRESCGGPELLCVTAEDTARGQAVVDLVAGTAYVFDIDGVGGAEGRVRLNVDALEAAETSCSDLRDVDADGRVDCQDDDCYGEIFCIEDCDNNRDDNNTGTIDCDDGYCYFDVNCFEDCNNGIDDNLDGVFDCDDSQYCGNVDYCGPNCPDFDLASNGSFRGDTIANYDEGVTTCGVGIGAGDTQIEFVAPLTTTYVASTAIASFNTVLEARAGCGGTSLACNNDRIGVRSQLEVSATAGDVLTFTVDGSGAAEGFYDLRVVPKETTESTCNDSVDNDNDGLIDCADSTCTANTACTSPTCPSEAGITTSPFKTYFLTTGRPNSTAGSCGSSNAEDRTIPFTAPATGTYTFDTFGSGYDTVLYARTACTGTELACNDDTSGLQSRITLSLTAGDQIVIVVDGFSTSDGFAFLNISGP